MLNKIVFITVFILNLGLYNISEAALPVKGAILVNLNTGRILYEQNANASVPPASLTKIMTMFLTLDAIKANKLTLNQKLPVRKLAANIGGSVMHITPGESVPVVRLLAGTAVASGNDAAMALAEGVGGSIGKFVRQMNVKAKNLGMVSTQFKNPTGLPASGQKTTARDLMLLCKAYLKTHPQVSRFHNMAFFMHKGRVTRNTNTLLGVVKGVDGLKTGWTVASGYNLIVTAQRGKTRLLAIVLGGKTRDKRDEAAVSLLEAGFREPTSPVKVRTLVNR